MNDMLEKTIILWQQIDTLYEIIGRLNHYTDISDTVLLELELKKLYELLNLIEKELKII